MPRGVRNTGTTSVQEPDLIASSEPRWSPEDVDEMMVGVPETITAINLTRIAGEDPALPAPPAFMETPTDKVILLNLKYENEKIWVPVADEHNVPRFVGDTILEFMDGVMLCTELQASFVERVSPHVYREPADGPLFEFAATGFKTRNLAAYNEYVRVWSELNT